VLSVSLTKTSTIIHTAHAISRRTVANQAELSAEPNRAARPDMPDSIDLATGALDVLQHHTTTSSGTGSHDVSPEADQHSFMKLYNHTILNTLRDSFPVDDTDRDAPQSAAVSERGINAKDFRGALHAINAAAAKNTQRVSRGLPKLPNLLLPDEDSQRLRKWTPDKLQTIIRRQKWYYQLGIHGSKRDIARSLDPVEHGLLTETRVSELFKA